MLYSGVTKSIVGVALIAAFTAAVRQTSQADDAAARQAVATSDSSAQAGSQSEMPDGPGVIVHESRAYPGYNLITPSDQATYLFDNDGRVVHVWPSKISTGVAYLLDNGHLFRTAEAADLDAHFQGPAKSGRFQEFNWDGNVVWDFEYHSDKRQPHHDAIKLPNGNVLMICWEMISEEEAVSQGRRLETVKDSHLQPDCLVEIRPTGMKTGKVVWEWRTWDHLIQDRDRTKPNYGRIADHPERFDVNYGEFRDDGQVRKSPDWMHVNAVAYNADLDQIVLSSPSFSEIWIIDHSTTTEEARGHTGGRWGKGGDILYRWGNPSAYHCGTKLEQRLFGQHNIQWIPEGLPGDGHLLVFNNGRGREPEGYSSVDEFEPPIDHAGNYIRGQHAPFGPDSPLWSYTAPNKTGFFSWFISGAQRLPNGNTLINAGAIGIIFEVTPEHEIVWRFSNPFPNEQPKANAAPRRFQIFSNAARDGLSMTEDQRKKLDEIGKDLDAKLDEALDPEQKNVLVGLDDTDVSGVARGEYLWTFQNDRLKLSESQAATLRTLAGEFNPKIGMMLTDKQKSFIKTYKQDQARRRPSARQARNTLFRAKRYGLSHPAFAGRTLVPGKTLVEIQQEREHPTVARQ